MNELLLKLREQLSSMIETLDNYIPVEDSIIVINKVDMKNLKWLKKNEHDRNLFEYKNTIRFTLSSKGGGILNYQKFKFDQIMDGSIDKIVLVKLTNETEMNGIKINYRLEDLEQTKLRDLYNN